MEQKENRERGNLFQHLFLVMNGNLFKIKQKPFRNTLKGLYCKGWKTLTNSPGHPEVPHSFGNWPSQTGTAE